MRCPRCDTENRETRRFCAGCGVVLPRACPLCGFLNDCDEKFCGGCGRAVSGVRDAAVPPAQPAGDDEGERRPVTVLFADLAGYTRLSSERDPEETHRILGRFFEVVDALVERYGGSIDKHIGDNVMAVFGAPIAHGDDPERAVRAAFAIVDDMPGLSRELGVEMAVHCGIASGEVMASGLGSARHREYTVTGAAVNLAARLQAEAGPGEILIAEEVQRAVDRAILCQDRGVIAIKGVTAPVAVCRAMAPRAEGAAAEARFIGRATELAQLRGLIAGRAESRRGITIHLRGDAGIGKTRLTEQFRLLAEAAGFSCHVGHVLDFGVAHDRDAVRTLVASLLGLAPGTSSELRERSADAAESVGLVAPEHRIFLNDLLGLPQPLALQTVYEAMDNTARNRGKQRTFAELVERTAAVGRSPSSSRTFIGRIR